MSNTQPSAALIAAIADLQEATTLSLVRQRLEAGDDPVRVIKDCQEGMRQVGLCYERHEYYFQVFWDGFNLSSFFDESALL